MSHHDPKFSLEGLFERYHTQAHKLIGNGVHLADEYRGPKLILDTELELQFTSIDEEGERRRPGHRSVIIAALDQDPNNSSGRRRLMGLGDLIGLPGEGRSRTKPEIISAYGPGGAFPEFSISRSKYGWIVFQQGLKAEIPGKKGEELKPGITRALRPQSMKSMNPEAMARAKIVTGAIERGLLLVESMANGNSLTEATMAADRQTA